MATATHEAPPIIEPTGVLHEVRHRVTVAEYHRMAESGIFGPEPRLELLEGVIVDKMTKNPPHNLTCDLVQHLFTSLMPVGFYISMGTSMTIEEREGEPEPDALVLRGKPRDYAGKRRTPSDAAMLIEVSDTSYNYDRFAKWAAYAAARVPVYWIVDLNRRRLEVHSEPEGAGETAYYAQTRIHNEDHEVPLILDGRELARFAVREILP